MNWCELRESLDIYRSGVFQENRKQQLIKDTKKKEFRIDARHLLRLEKLKTLTIGEGVKFKNVKAIEELRKRGVVVRGILKKKKRWWPF